MSMILISSFFFQFVHKDRFKFLSEMCKHSLYNVKEYMLHIDK